MQFVQYVVPHTGYVSWNISLSVCRTLPIVVPHTGYVSWNFCVVQILSHDRVVPHTGYVSWNNVIEAGLEANRVVPHTGYVSWNHCGESTSTDSGSRTPHGVRELKCRGRWVKSTCLSLYPTRGTWVEIIISDISTKCLTVVSHTGYVNWNLKGLKDTIDSVRRTSHEVQSGHNDIQITLNTYGYLYLNK